jgi:hypothetical protein
MHSQHSLRTCLLLLQLLIHISCTGMEREEPRENPYSNLAICYRESRLHEFLPEESFYHLMLTNKALCTYIFDRRAKQLAFYMAEDTSRKIDIAPDDLKKRGFSNLDPYTLYFQPSSIIMPLSGNYAVALARGQSETICMNGKHGDVSPAEYMYDNNNKPVLADTQRFTWHFHFTHPPCSNTNRDTLLVCSDNHLTLVRFGKKTITPLATREHGYPRARLTYEATQHAFLVKRLPNPEWLEKSKEDPNWEIFIEPTCMTDNRYYTDISGKKMGLASFDFVPLFQQYLRERAPSSCTKIKDIESTLPTVIKEHILHAPTTQKTDLWNDVATTSLITFFNSPLETFNDDPFYAAHRRWDIQQTAHIMTALHQGGDLSLHKKLRNELIENVWRPLKPGYSTEINIFGERRIKNNFFFSWGGSPYAYDSSYDGSGTRSTEVYEAIVPLGSLAHISFTPQKPNAYGPQLPYSSPETLVRYLQNLAQQKADAEKV